MTVPLKDVLDPAQLDRFEKVNAQAIVLDAERRRHRKGRKYLPGYREANQAALVHARTSVLAAVLEVLPAIERFFTERDLHVELNKVRELDRWLQSRGAAAIWGPDPQSPAQMIADVARL